MRYRLLLLTVLLQLWYIPMTMASDEVNDRFPSTKEFELSTRGIFSVFQKGKSIYLAIPEEAIGREVEIRAQINSGFDMVARPTESLGVVRIVKKGDETICLLRELYGERLLTDADTQLREAFLSSNTQSPERCYKIEAYSPDHGYLIEVTDELLSGDEWFSYNYPNIRQMDPKASRLTQVTPVPDGVSFKVRRMHGYFIDKDRQISYVMILPKGTMPLEVECIFRLLSREDMPLRLATYRRVPYTIRFRDYTQDDYTAVTDSILVHWDLSSRSKLPLTFHVDRLFPEYYLPAVRRCIEFWNDRFRRAGLAAPLRFHKDDGRHPLAAQRAVIAYDLVRPGVESHLTWHPRTGEVLSCRINVGHGFMGDKLADYLLTHALVDKDIVRDNNSRHHAVALLEEELRQKIGEALGVYSPEDISWAYRPYLGAKDCYEDRERGLAVHGKQKDTSDTTPVQEYAKKLGNLSVVVSKIETITSETKAREISRKTSALYPRACKLYAGYLKELIDSLDAYPPQEQEEALRLLEKYLFSGKDLMDAPYVRMRSRTGLWQMQEGVLKDVFRHILTKWDNAHAVATFLPRMYRCLFTPSHTGVSLTPYQMNLQLLFVSTWIEESRNSRHLGRALQLFYATLQEPIKTELSSDSRAHYEYICLKIRQGNLHSA